MDIKDIHNYKYTKNTFVKLTNGATFKVSVVDFANKNQPIEAQGGEWLEPKQIEELFERTKPTIAKLPFGTEFLYNHNGVEYTSLNGVKLRNSKGDKVYAIAMKDKSLFISDIAERITDYELLD